MDVVLQLLNGAAGALVLSDQQSNTWNATIYMIEICRHTEPANPIKLNEILVLVLDRWPPRVSIPSEVKRSMDGRRSATSEWSSRCFDVERPTFQYMKCANIHGRNMQAYWASEPNQTQSNICGRVGSLASEECRRFSIPSEMTRFMDGRRSVIAEWNSSCVGVECPTVQ